MYWLGIGMMVPVNVLYFSSQGYPPAMVGFFLALNSIIPFVFAMPAGGFIDRIGTRKSVLIGTTLCTASGLMYIVGGNQSILLLFLTGQIINGFGALLTWGACTGINQPMALIMVANIVQPHEGMGMSIRTMANRSVQFINPLFVGAVTGIFGLSIGFGIVGAVWVLAETAFHFMRAREANQVFTSLK